jgi:5'-deoxynucleotidase YfbR-like HD superfamily hydrolase
MHSDHCIIVAMYGYLLADLFGADREDAWLIGLCHHFHNASLPDSGFTGEMMLGEHLERVIETLRTRTIRELPECYQARVERLFKEINDVTTPLAKTFHAADTIDRVVQMEHYERAAKFQVRHALLDLNLVHEGAAQAFQHELLRSTGLFADLI